MPDEALTHLGNASQTEECPLGGRDEFTAILVPTQLVISLIALLGNGLVLYLVRVDSSLHTSNNLFVCALAASDVLVCVNIPFYISFYFDVPYVCDKTLCTIRFLVAVFVTVLSVLLMVGVAIDRYLSVIHSLKYHALIRFKFVKRLIVAVYSYVVLVVVAPAYWAIQWERPLECDIVFIFKFWYTCLVVLFHVTLALIVTVCVYFTIFRQAWKIVQQECQCLMSAKTQQLHAEAKTAKTMFLILGLHMLSLAPYLVIMVWRYFDLQEEDQPMLSDVKKFVCVLYFGKSAVNPLIYGWKNKEMRRALARWWKDRTAKSGNVNSSIVNHNNSNGHVANGNSSNNGNRPPAQQQQIVVDLSDVKIVNVQLPLSENGKAAPPEESLRTTLRDINNGIGTDQDEDSQCLSYDARRTRSLCRKCRNRQNSLRNSQFEAQSDVGSLLRAKSEKGVRV